MGEGFFSWLRGGGMSRQERELSGKERRKEDENKYDGETVEPHVFRAGQDPIKIGGSDVRLREEVAVSTGKDASVVVKKGVEYAPDARKRVDGESVQVGGNSGQGFGRAGDNRYYYKPSRQPHDKGQRKERWE